MTTPVLAHYNPSKPIELICDASGGALGCVLIQDGHPVAFESRKLSAAETRYDTGERELLAVMHALKVWRCYLEGVQFTLVTDHKPNTYLKSIENWNDRQARWNQKLERFSYKWQYRQGKLNVADPLSRLELNALTRSRARKEAAAAKPSPSADKEQPVDKSPSPSVVEERSVEKNLPEMVPDLRRPKGTKTVHQPRARSEEEGTNVISADMLKSLYETDAWKKEVAAWPKHYKEKPNGMWYYGDRLAIPSAKAFKVARVGIIREHHDTPFAGHRGFNKTKQSVGRAFYWRGMHTEILHYCNECFGCQKNKGGRRPYGLLQPIQPPTKKWGAMSMDFITNLPETEENFSDQTGTLPSCEVQRAYGKGTV